MRVHLLKSVCLPALLYATEVLPLTKTDISMLNHLVDRAVYRIFGCTSGEDIQFVRSVLDLPCLGTCIKKRLVGFLNSFSHSFSWAAMLRYVI